MKLPSSDVYVVEVECPTERPIGGVETIEHQTVQLVLHQVPDRKANKWG